MFSDVCAPVVITVSTNKAENLCLKNGLLFHELLRFKNIHLKSILTFCFNISVLSQLFFLSHISAFGHCDGLNSIIRSGGTQIHVSDAQIRFERASEAKAKTVTDVEDVRKFPILNMS